MNTTSRESDSKTDERIDKLADQLSTLVEIVSKKVVTPAPVKAVEETCVTCGGAHSWYNCPTTDNNQASVCATTGTYNQVNPPNRVSNQMAPLGFDPMQNNGQNRFNNHGQGNNFNRGNNLYGNQGFQAQNNHALNFQNQGFQNQPFQVPNNQAQQKISNDFSRELQEGIRSNCGLFQNHASTSGTLPSNTIPNPKGEMKAITTRSGVAYEGPSIPTNPSPKKVVERETEETTDKDLTTLSDSNKDECLAPGDDIEILLHYDPSTPMKSIASILEGFIDDQPFEENDDLFDLECETNDWKIILYDAPIDKGALYLRVLLSWNDNTHNLSSDVFFDHEPQHIKNESNHDTLITFSPMNDPLHYEFAGGVNLDSNSSSRSSENFHTIIEDSDSNREEIDIFSGPDDSIPSGGCEINVEVDDSFTFVTRTFLLYLTYPEVSPLLSSTKNEDTIFDPGIST
ncbi:hypothetical protein Tco_1016087 [Tanacetum coccineum]|uniref:Reverse transcriptase domain-containing protein n=1 Tax=Tanacetum coccineum TaxID=301880 RepID=A0ABQ5FMP1_9ASTR